MLSFVRLHSPLTRQIASRPTRSLCTARLQYLPTPSVFEGKAKYVVLSDLHVKRETVDTCIQALQIAHDEALKRDAAILFLGDFWHARGNLPVQPLNAVLTHLATWRVPVVMIPGNHDLISRGGHGVSLVPLATTLGEDRCLLITKPTLCLEALFLPYMHDTATLKSVLKEASVHPHEPHAIFCHVEVSGARLADRIVSASSSRSIDPSDFPPKTNVYSGHIHRPHVVTDVIHYVGSPYQVSASEHGQQKSLLVLDKSQGWRIIEHIPIDIGPRHFTINYLSPFILPKFRRADRLTLLASGNTARNFVEALRDDGIRVELQPLRNHNINSKDSNTDDLFAPVEPRISQGTLSNSGLFSEYAAIKNLGKDVTRAGAEVLRELGGHMSSNMSGKEVVVQWKEVFLRGFGTFLGSATYPLENRGLVLLTGRDCDADGVITGRTNATGKTTLAMAALWAMTGRTDARPDGSVEKGVSLEMVHDDARECEVSVKLDLSGERALSEAREMIPNEDKNRFQAHVTDQGHSQQTLNVVVKRTSTRNGKYVCAKTSAGGKVAFRI